MSELNALGLLILLGGLIALSSLPYEAWRARRLRRHGVRTTGTVLGHVVAPDQVEKIGAEFVDQHGQNVSLIIDRIDMPYTGVIAVGKQFDVLYLPTRPRDARPAKLTPKVRQHSLYSRYMLFILHLVRIWGDLAILVFRLGQHGRKGTVAEYRLRRWLRKHGIRAQATVMWHEHNKRKLGMRPLIGYVDRDGRTRTFEGDEHEDGHLPPIGREMPVVYDPNLYWAHPDAAPDAGIFDDLPSFTDFLRKFLLILVTVVVGSFLLTI
jgi:hypothetical protein